MRGGKFGRQITRTIGVAVAILACAAVTWAAWHVAAGGSTTDHATAPPAGAEMTVLDADAEARIEAFCADCHLLPRPDSFPRDAWHNEITVAYGIHAKSGRQDLQPPPMEETFAYYRQRAPEQLTFPVPPEAPHKLAVPFRVEKLSIWETGRIKPAVAHLHWLSLRQGAEPELIVTDMRRGTLTAISPGTTGSQPRLLAYSHHPCHVESCDLGGDGTVDLVVADLGSMAAIDHHRGRVVWLRPDGEDGSYEPIVLASELGRVDDVRPGDFDNDGDIDLLVAVFGMDRTGDTRILWNVSQSADKPQFEHEIIDPRPGPIHVPPYDFDGDGYLDFASLISQEHEQVAVFINQHGSPQKTVSFHMQSLWEGPDLTFGSNGIQLTDLDQDGDIDVLYTNGDAFDNNFVNPRHGVQWLENQGRLNFAYHRLADLVGACVASAGDLDLDGDLDIIATAWLPDQVQPANVYDRPLSSIICLEQTAPGQFVRHTLEENSPIHAGMCLADFDQDGDLDFAVGFASNQTSPNGTQWVDIWWNQLRTPGNGGSISGD